jgi:hypothetical protein
MHIISSIGWENTENTEVSKNCLNDVCEYNRTHMAGENLRKIQPGSGTSDVCSFSKLGLPNTH